MTKKTAEEILADAIGGNDETQGVRSWVTTGFKPLDHAISGKYNGGGLPVGRIVEIFGPSSCGKTAITTNAMAEAQRQGGVALFLDHERSFEKGLAQQLGLDISPAKFGFKTPKTFEESIMMAIKFCRAVRENELIKPDAPIVVAFDSLAAMVPQSKMAKDVDAQGMNDSLALAKATSSVFPTLAQYAEEFQALMIVLNQIRLKPGVMYGDPTTTPGGEAPRYYASVRLQLGAKKIIDEKSKEMQGQEISCKCIKNKVAIPFRTAKWDFKFRPETGEGYFDIVASSIDYLAEKGLLPSAGPRVTWTDGKSYFRSALAKKIEEESLQAELQALFVD